MDMDTNSGSTCRICFRELEFPNNYKQISEIDDEDNVKFIIKIRHCSGITPTVTVQDQLSNLPNRICEDCLDNLKKAYKFCTMCTESELKLQETCKRKRRNSGNRSKIKSNNEVTLENIKTEIFYSEIEQLDNPIEAETNYNSNDEDQEIKPLPNLCTDEEDFKSNLLLSKRKYLKKKSKESSYSCEVCKVTFLTRNQMTQHMKTDHELPYKCKNCDKGFETNISRNKHEKRAHMDPANKYKCDVCVKTFYRLDLLKKHKLVHTGEKPFICEKCGSAFKQIHHLKNHSKSMTPCVLKLSIKI